MMSKKNLRERLKNMRLYDNTDLVSKNLDGKPLFSNDELLKEPLKWLKYLVMDRVGLEPISKISYQIKRFNIFSVELAKNWANKQFSTSLESEKMIVAKVVPWDYGAQLKNYVMFSQLDVEPNFKKIMDEYPHIPYELWCCESPIGAEGFNLGGRINYPKGDKNQILELVWYASPRLIEKVNLSSFKYPYLRAERNSTNPQFRIKVLHIPSEYSIKTGVNIFEEDFKWIAKELEYNRKPLELLSSTLYEFGAKEICFCFKVTEGNLTIIDWDTEIESINR